MMHNIDNNIQQGYKQSPLGVIPQDWEVRRLGEIVDYRKGFAFKSELYSNCGIRIIRISDTNATGIKEVNEPIFLQSDLLSQFSSYILKENDIIVQTVGSRPPLYDSMVGKAICVSNRYAGSLLNQNLVVLYPINIYSSIIFNALKSKRYINHIESIVRGNANQVSITLDELFSFTIIVPPLAEQERISEVLSCWDRAIEMQDTLVKKLDRRKRALMQQLLTARKRLPNFSAPWQTVKLGKLGTTYNGLIGKTKDDFDCGNAYYVTYMNVFSNGNITSQLLGKVDVNIGESQNAVRYGDIFFTVSSETPEEVGMSSVLLTDMDNTYLNSFCFGYRLNDFNTLLPEFAQYLFRGAKFRKAMSIIAQGSTRYNISKSSVLELSVSLPSVKEQKAISQILTTADREIELATIKLNTLRTQKRALMQQLLTGKKRLKI